MKNNRTGNSQLRKYKSEKKTVREARSHLNQQVLEDMENLKMQNSEALSLKLIPENQILELEDMKAKQNQEIQDLKCKISSLEKSICSVEEKLAKLEDEFKKEKRSSSTQTENEQKVEKAHIWTHLEEVIPPPIAADALSSTQSEDPSGKVLTKMGPNRPSVQPTWSSKEGSLSLKQQAIVPSSNPGLQNETKTKSFMTNPAASHGVPFSPLKIGSAPPKHAIRVPGRVPSKQESSDQMHKYPIPGNKTINFSFAAFTKTNLKPKRRRSDRSPSTNAKRLRRDGCSPDPAGRSSLTNSKPRKSMSAELATSNSPSTSNEECKTKEEANTTQSLFSSVFKTLQESCYDMLPAIRNDVILGRMSEVPVLTEEEKSVISYFCANQPLAERFMSAILCKIKVERAVMKPGVLQSLCRVYLSLCQEAGDYHKAHALAYRLLKEDFPEAPMLILFMVTAWPSVLSHNTSLCRAIHIVSKLKAKGEILDYLSEYLHWDERPPAYMYKEISSTLKALLKDSRLKFQKNSWYGDDLCTAAWEYVFSLDLLCGQLSWTWTYTNIIQKELWLILNTWLRQPRPRQTPVRDVCVAAILRLIGRLGQWGLKMNLARMVQKVATGITQFGKHGLSSMPLEVQLSVVYTTHDLAPSNPREALETLASWKEQLTQPVPPAVISCITQIRSLCHQLKP